jgi:hypothetical protein
MRWPFRTRSGRKRWNLEDAYRSSSEKGLGLKLVSAGDWVRLQQYQGRDGDAAFASERYRESNFQVLFPGQASAPRLKQEWLASVTPS